MTMSVCQPPVEHVQDRGRTGPLDSASFERDLEASDSTLRQYGSSKWARQHPGSVLYDGAGLPHRLI